MSKQSLKGKRIAFLAVDGFEQVELTKPWESIRNRNRSKKASEKTSPKIGWEVMLMIGVFTGALISSLLV